MIIHAFLYVLTIIRYRIIIKYEIGLLRCELWMQERFFMNLVECFII